MISTGMGPRFAVAGMLVIGLVAGCAPESDDAAAVGEEEPGALRVGALMPMTGDLRAYGETSLNGLRLAVQQVNAQGGVRDSEMRILAEDTESQPSIAVNHARSLVASDGVPVLIGPHSSDGTIEVAEQVAIPEGALQISHAATSPAITALDDDDRVFRTVPSDAYQGIALAELVAGEGIEEVAILHVDNEFGVGLSGAFVDAFEEGGGTVGATVAFADVADAEVRAERFAEVFTGDELPLVSLTDLFTERADPTYEEEIARAADVDAEALVLIAYPQTGAHILRQVTTADVFDRFVLSGSLHSRALVDAVGAGALDGAFGAVPAVDEDSEAAATFASDYRDIFGTHPSGPFIDTTYDAAFVTALASQAAGSRDPARMRDALREVANPPGEVIGPGEWREAVDRLDRGEAIQYRGASGDIEFDEHGDVAGSYAHWVIRDGRIVTERVFRPGSD